LTRKHKNDDKKEQKNAEKNVCICGKSFKYRQGLFVHRKICTDYINYDSKYGNSIDIKIDSKETSKKIEDIFEVFNLKEESIGKFKMKKDLIQFMINKMNIKSGNSTVQGKIDRALNTNGFAYSHKYRYINNQETQLILDDIEENINITNKEWKELNINEHTKKYMVSSKGQVKLDDALLKPHKVRGRKYYQLNINIGENKHEKYYVHQLVWIAQKGPISDDKIILHNDEVELVDKYHRNWLCDLRLDNHSTNNKEYHFQKRINLS
jgi:hypothetical protein